MILPNKTNSKGQHFEIVFTLKLKDSGKWIGRTFKHKYEHEIKYTETGETEYIWEDYNGKLMRYPSQELATTPKLEWIKEKIKL